MRPCPLHSECERYLLPEQCEYRSGEIAYEEAENLAYHLSGLSPCDGFADND